MSIEWQLSPDLARQDCTVIADRCDAEVCNEYEFYAAFKTRTIFEFMESKQARREAEQAAVREKLKHARRHQECQRKIAEAKKAYEAKRVAKATVLEKLKKRIQRIEKLVEVNQRQQAASRKAKSDAEEALKRRQYRSEVGRSLFLDYAGVCPSCDSMRTAVTKGRDGINTIACLECLQAFDKPDATIPVFLTWGKQPRISDLLWTDTFLDYRRGLFTL